MQLQEDLSDLSEVEVEEAEGAELKAHGAAEEEPEGQRLQAARLGHVVEVEGEERGPEGRPEQTQEQEHTPVAEALVSVVQDEPELRVDEEEEQRVEQRVDGRERQLQYGAFILLLLLLSRQSAEPPERSLQGHHGDQTNYCQSD